MTEPRTAVSGRSAIALDLQRFAKAFVAELVSHDLVAVRPKSPTDRRGFASVVRLLDQMVRELQERNGDKGEIRQLIRIVNELRPSNTGGFEGFEAALRSLQLTFSSCPNPFYEEIAFNVPKTYARATVDELPEFGKKLVNAAANAFIQEVRPEGK
jgi:hypothetical protein